MANTHTEPEATSAAAPAPAAKKPKKQLSLSISQNVLSFVVVVGVLGYLIYGSWQSFQAPVAAAVPQLSATPAVPELKLNQDNKRQAPPITVDQNGIGKTDPFSSN